MPGEAQEKPRRDQEGEAEEGPTERPTWNGNVLKPFVFHVKTCARDHRAREVVGVGGATQGWTFVFSTCFSTDLTM